MLRSSVALIVRYFLVLGNCTSRYRRRSRRPTLLETGSAKHRTPLRGLKRHGGFRGALRADGPGFRAYTAAGSRHPLVFALLAPLRIILELLVVKEQLFPSGKDEVVTAI